MKTMIATFGICFAMAIAGCAQKADTNTNLAAFGDDSPPPCCAAKAAAAKTDGKACCAGKSKADCSKSKAAGSGCPFSSKSNTETN